MEHPHHNLRLTPMKIKSIFLLYAILILMIVLLAACSMPLTTRETETSDLDITQAYQTVDAQLTQAVGQTPVPPTKTSPPESAAATPTPGDAASTQPPTATKIPSEPTATFLPTFTNTAATTCDKAEAAYPNIDITIPDDTTIPAGNSFTKVWRVVNTGTCNWTAEYAVVFFAGDQMDAPDSVNIDEPVAPGQSIDLDVTMVAPQETGTYQGNWMIRNADGDNFGIGPNANDSFWVRIVVVEAEDTPTPTVTPAPDPDVLVSGSLTLNPQEGIDFDTLQLNSSGEDLVYELIKSDDVVSGHQLVSLFGVEIGIFGDGQPTYGGCKTTDMGISNIDLQTTTPGTYFCITTDQGLTGWGRLDGLDDENNVVSLTILTWAALEE